MLRIIIAAIALAIVDAALLGGSFYFQGASLAQELTLQFNQTMESSLTALGLILQNTLLGGDEVMAETIINAMFDGSMLQSVTLKDLDAQVAFSRTFAEPMGNYPHWLAELYPITELSREMEMTDGWNILGDLHVASHPHHLYQAMWNVLSDRLPIQAALALGAWLLQVSILIWLAARKR
ncbi:LapD/MoxY N-terminal periplasmic domain-containing protein [Motilimonas sp. KMU-193]|uniref:LapD/MoxY N-terminal periplasmic domain-containing protein n=1 Tax=Motilimonas sp. KMU-193 TaxID=3388668 RepID=UPI00396B0C70